MNIKDLHLNYYKIQKIILKIMNFKNIITNNHIE
jgi:hypothetical protein